MDEEKEESFWEDEGETIILGLAALFGRKHERHTKLDPDKFGEGELENAPQFERNDCWQMQHITDLELLSRVRWQWTQVLGIEGASRQMGITHMRWKPYLTGSRQPGPRTGNEKTPYNEPDSTKYTFVDSKLSAPQQVVDDGGYLTSGGRDKVANG